jgi:hypothetical protein
MALEDDVLTLLQAERRALDDDEIAERLGANRHYINAVSRRLASRGQIIRAPGPAGKLINRIHGVPKATMSNKVPSSRKKRRPKVDPDLRVSALIERFGEALRTFEESNAFPGPSLYFHEKAIERRRTHTSFSSVLGDERFFEYVYAMLPAWGMHRMGKAKAKVGDFEVMVKSFHDQAPQIEALFQRRLDDLPPEEVESCADIAWNIIANLKVSTSGTRIVAGSKALHHVLPDLIPPIDRQYTWRFFTGQTTYLPKGGEEAAFLNWLPRFAAIASRQERAITEAIARGGFMATGVAKVVDNAIMGFMQLRGEIEEPSEEA